MSLLSKLRLVTVDVTGTLIAYKGQLGDYYCMAAKSAGMPCPDYKRMHEGFKAAYTEMTVRHPCFGHASNMPNIDWWKMCVKDSFIRVNTSCNLPKKWLFSGGKKELSFRCIAAILSSSACWLISHSQIEFWSSISKLIRGLFSSIVFLYSANNTDIRVLLAN